jgi:AraC-like DNA-binding protein
MRDYFVYLPEPATWAATWEAVAVSAGFTRVPAGSPYPVYRHPTDHHFTWADGRTLGTYTIVFIVEGSGLFESSVQKFQQRIQAGTVFIVFPNIWHRYAPAARTGWTEHWLEVRGPAFDRLLHNGAFSPSKAVIRTGLDSDLLQGFESCHAWAQKCPPGNQAVLATLGLQIFALLEQIDRRTRPAKRAIDEVIHRAQSLMTENCHRRVDMRQLARQLGVGYSLFRQSFRALVGISPKQYHLRLQLRRAEELLTNTTKSAKEISEILGFDSPYHFSAVFKAHTSLAPSHWRERRARTTANGTAAPRFN